MRAMRRLTQYVIITLTPIQLIESRLTQMIHE